MKKYSLLFSGCVLLSSVPVLAETAIVPKGALVVRYGAANTNDNYKNQDGYPDVLQNVSAVCSTDNSGVDKDKVWALIQTDRNHPNPLKKAGGTNASTLINLNATVKSDPLPGNPNHCLINNIALKNIKGAWQIFDY